MGLSVFCGIALLYRQSLVEGLKDAVTDLWCAEALSRLGIVAKRAAEALLKSAGLRGKAEHFRRTAAEAFRQVHGIQMRTSRTRT